MAHTFRDRRRIEFYETDMAGIVHFSNFFRFMESTEHAFFRSLGLSLHRGGPEGMSGWARVGAQCEFRRPLHYMDEVEIELVVREKKQTSLAYDFVFRRVADRDGPVPPDEVATGRLSVVHVTAANGARMKAAGMPPDVARAIDVAPSS
ncbi:MAG TPA: acyl-CoA thioesterase [Planctomycetota bacterium]